VKRKIWQKDKTKDKKDKIFLSIFLMKLLITAFFLRFLPSLPSKASRLSNQHKKTDPNYWLSLKINFKINKKMSIEKNGVFSKIPSVKRRKRQKWKKLIKWENFVFFCRFVIVAAPFLTTHPEMSKQRFLRS
jgi:hypothetical protein